MSSCSQHKTDLDLDLDLPGGPVVKNHRFHPWSSKIQHASGQLSPCATTTEPRLWSPCSATREASATASPSTATREQLRLTEARESPRAETKTQSSQN